MHKLKRGLVALLILVMVLSMLPVTALANADTAPSAEPEATTEVAAVPAEDSQDKEGEVAVQSETQGETAVSELPNVQSMMPLEEKTLPDLDLTGYLPGELWEFPVAKLVQLLGLPETPAVYALRYFEPIDGGWRSLGPDAFEKATSDGTIDLYGNGTNDSMTLVLICGTADQLDMSNTRYIVDVKMTTVFELFNVELYTLDHQKAQLDKNSGDVFCDRTGKVFLWGISLNTNQNDPMWDYLKTDYRYYVSLSLNKCLGDDVVVRARNAIGDDLGDDITDMLFDQSATGGYLQGSGNNKIYIMLLRTGHDASKTSWLPFSFGPNSSASRLYVEGLYADGEDSTYREDVVSDHTSNLDTNELTYTLKPGYAVDGQYYVSLGMFTYHSTGSYYEHGDNVRKAVVGNYASEEDIPANATDIKAQLFADASVKGDNNGFKANYSKGVTFTVIDFSGNALHLTVKTVDTLQVNPSSYTGFNVYGANQEANVGEDEQPIYPSYASYCLDYENDSYYTNGYRVVFLLKSGENNTYGPVTDQNIRPVFYTDDNVKVHASVGGAGAELQDSGSTLIPFTSGEPVQYTATAADGKTTQNYWVTFLTQQSGPKLFVNAANDTTHYAEVDGQKMPQRELHLTGKYSNHDVFFANVGDANITGLYVKLENAENVALDDYWTVGKTTTLSAFTTTDRTKTYGDLANTAKIRLVPAVDESTGEMLSGAISGTLVIGYTGGGTEPVEEVRINLTGTAGEPRIITDGSKLHNGVKYVPYSVLIQTNSMGSNDNMVFSVVSGKLPDGLSLKPNGEIYGVPTKPGTYTFTIKGVYGGNESSASTMDGTITIEKNTDENVLAVNDSEYGHKLIDAAPDKINMKNVVTRGGLAYLVVSSPMEGGVTGEMYKWETPIALHSEGPLDECVKVFIDGKLLTEGVDYDAESGSTRVSIRTAALKNLSNGTHTIAIEFRENGDTDGDMKTTSQNITINGSKDGSTSSGSKDSGKTTIDNGDGTYITTVTEVVTVGKLSSADKALLDALLNGRGDAGVYMDISAVVMERSTGKILRYLTETSSPLKVTVDIPQAMLDAQKDGKFIYVVRIHDGKAEFLDTTIRGSKATFSSDKFSTYALVTMDERVAGVKTGDAGVTAYVLVAFVAVAAGAGVVVAQKRRSRKA